VVDQSFIALQKRLSADWIQSTIAELNHCQREMKWTNTPKIFIEITILQITETKSDQEISNLDTKQVLQLSEKLDKLEKELQALKENKDQTGQQNQSQVPKQGMSTSKNKYRIPYERIRQVLGEAEKKYLQEIHGKWATFMKQLKQQSAPAHAVLQDAKPSAASIEVIVISFKYDIHCSLA